MIHIYYGNGKGKTSAAIGLIIRALSTNKKIALYKFFKKKNSSGEDNLLLKQKNVDIYYSDFSHPFFLKNPSIEYNNKIYANQKELFNSVYQAIKKKYKYIILDEVLDLIKLKIISTQECLSLFQSAGKEIELVLTGHYINRKLIKHADLVTQMKKIKHYFDDKVKARKGIEF